MCGICGIVNRESAEPAEAGLLDRMTDVLAHRGPDGRGVRIDRFVGLGHRRLSVIDPSPRARQPMSNEDDTVWITCNGEIYNHLSLRESLTAKGHRFRSESDAEVILHLYEDMGDDCIHRLRGMFAFALWDRRSDRLLLVRDRLGQKPLFYTETTRRFLFGSEIKSLLQDAEQPRTPNPNALYHFLSLGYVPGEASAFAGIRSLPPAHMLVYQNGQARLQRYWSLSYAPSQPDSTTADPRTVALELMDRLGECVRMRLMSDVPLGAFLSGGIDSAAVVTLMTRFMDRPVKTFSIAFREKSHDESPWARLVAKHLHTEHEEYVFTPDLVADIPRIVAQFDEPFGDPSALPTDFLSRAARRSVTVALNGDGGDENFFGYDRYLKNKVALAYYRLPRIARAVPAKTLGPLVPNGLSEESLVKRLAAFFRFEPASRSDLYCRWLLFFDRQQRRGLFTEEFMNSVVDGDTDDLIAELMAASDGKDTTETAVHADILSYLPNDLLVKMDRTTMAHSLEGRSPFLDHEFMEYVAALPADIKLKRLTRKWILKRAVSDFLPREVLHRPKRGFGIPVGDWLRNDLKDLMCDTLTSRRSRQRGIFKPRKIDEMIEQHLNRQRNWQFQLWNLLVLELWHGILIDSRPGVTAEDAYGVSS